jgi:hypothetical protein
MLPNGRNKILCIIQTMVDLFAFFFGNWVIFSLTKSLAVCVFQNQ